MMHWKRRLEYKLNTPSSLKLWGDSSGQKMKILLGMGGYVSDILTMTKSITNCWPLSHQIGYWLIFYARHPTSNGLVPIRVAVRQFSNRCRHVRPLWLAWSRICANSWIDKFLSITFNVISFPISSCCSRRLGQGMMSVLAWLALQYVEVT